MNETALAQLIILIIGFAGGAVIGACGAFISLRETREQHYNRLAREILNLTEKSANKIRRVK
jgi:hypothetical protein